MTRQLVRVAVLLSGSGRTLSNFLAQIESDDLPIEIVAVVSSRRDVRGVTIARDAGIPIGIFRRRDYSDIADHNAAQNTWLMSHDPQLILLAGYLCFYQRSDIYSGPILNIHPALLPRHGGKGMYGARVHQAVLAAGDQEPGCTVHHVTDVYDAGNIVAQQRVPVFPEDTVDTLAARVFTAECELYPKVVTKLAHSILGKTHS